MAGPQAPYTEAECAHVKAFIDSGGGSCLVLFAEGGEAQLNTNVNFVLEEFGMSVNADCVVRTQYYKYLHPKECMIGGGIVCTPIWRELLAQPHATRIPFAFGAEQDQLHFVYPFGATLTVTAPANVLCTTGAVAYPFNRPLVGFYQQQHSAAAAGSGNRGGRLLVVGSGHMFHDRYVAAEQTNMLLFEYFVRLLSDLPAAGVSSSNGPQFTMYDFSDEAVVTVDGSDGGGLVPDTTNLAEQPKMSLLESVDCDIPADFKKMFNMRLHSISNDLVPLMMALHRQLNVQYEPLKIIKPQFEIPLPALQLAVFQPVFSDLAMPGLELFDLDESFSSERMQVAQLSNRYLRVSDELRSMPNSRELEYFVLECGRILGIPTTDGTGKLSGKEVLHRMSVKISKYKKLDRD